MISEPEIIDRRYRAIGGAAELFRSTDREVLCESGAMTGKSHSLLRLADYTAQKHPGCRQFFARDTRKSLTQSVLVEWEEAILWPGHPAIVGTAQRAQREHYVYPNGSEIVLFGLDSPGDHMSTQYDRGYVFEAVQIKQEAWEFLLTRMRNGKAGYHQLVADCNPGPRGHWLNQRFPKAGEPNPQLVHNEDGVLVSSRRRILYRHEDNPRLYDPDTGVKTKFGAEYIDGTLNALVGARRKRLKDHLWVSEEGQIWPEFDEDVHCVYRKDIPELRSYTASMDFGTNAPGCLQVWGYDSDQKAYRVAEVYKRGWSIDQWADAMVSLNREFPFQIGVGDCAAAGDILFLNKRLRAERGESFGWVGCDKTKGANHGRDLVRDLIRRKVLFFVKDSIRFGVDEDLRGSLKPVCTEQEIPSYVYRVNEEGKDIKDEPAPGVADHGCFPAGTHVRMAGGSEKAIERVVAGDVVWTPNGSERVVAAGSMGISPTVVVEFENGSQLRCTPDHPIHVHDLGMIRADMLSSEMEVSSWPETDDAKRVSSKDVCGVDTRTARIGAIDISGGRRSIYIGSSGSAPMARSRMDSRYTTSMATDPTTELRTSCSCLRRSTARNIDSIRRVSYKSARMCVSKENATASAMYVVHRCQPEQSLERVCVRTHVGRRIEGGRVSMMSSEPVRSVEPFSRSIATSKSGLARLRVREVYSSAPCEVFNLTVDPTHVYVADGVLVSNCDATIYNSTYKFGRDINPAPTRWVFPKPKWGEISLAADFLEIAEKEGW